jgi:hypothetical protein
MKLRKYQVLLYTAHASRSVLTNRDARKCSCMLGVVTDKPLTITQEVA